MSFPGAVPYPEIGHGLDFAWTGTTAMGDNQDTFADPSVIRAKDGWWYAYGTTDPLREGEGTRHLIPTARGELTQRHLLSLDKFRDGQEVIIREVQDDNPARLRRWQAQGLTPGEVVRVRSYQPLDDLFELEVGGRVLLLGSEALAGLRGEEVTAAPGGAAPRADSPAG